jgi:hypothetical protein
VVGRCGREVQLHVDVGGVQAGQGWLGVEDASTSGNMCLYGATTTAKTVKNGDSYPLIAGQLSITFG